MAYYDDIKDKKAPFESHYISAYGLAVKHGFTGSEEEWLESLSDYGIAKKHGFTGSEEEWNDAVNEAREAAEAAKASAQEYAESASKVAEDLEKSYNPHLLDESNPHGVTASQVGAYTKEKVDELLSGKSDSRHTHKESDNHLKNTDNPHKVTAEQLGAYPKDKLYTKEEVDELLSGKSDSGHGHMLAKHTVIKYTGEEIKSAVSIIRGNGVITPDKACCVISNIDSSDRIAINPITEVGNGVSYKLGISCEKCDIVYSTIDVYDHLYMGQSCSLICSAAYSTGELIRIELLDCVPGATITVYLEEFTDSDGFMSGAEKNDIAELKSSVYNLNSKTSGIERNIGDIDTALDSILDIQNGLIGGDAV